MTNHSCAVYRCTNTETKKSDYTENLKLNGLRKVFVRMREPSWPKHSLVLHQFPSSYQLQKGLNKENI